MTESSSNAYESASSSVTTDATILNAAQWHPNAVASWIGCVLGTLIAGLLIHFLDPVFQLPKLPELGISPSRELVQKHVAAQNAFWSSNYAFDFGLLGLCLGLCVGLITTQRRQVSSGVVGGAGGLLGGMLAGYFLGFAISQNIIESVDQSLLRSTAYHFASWAAMLGGLVFAIALIQDGIRRASAALPIGILTGLLVASVYNVLSSACFTSGNLSQLIPSSGVERVFWGALCSIVSGLGIYFGLRPQAAKDRKQVT